MKNIPPIAYEIAETISLVLSGSINESGYLYREAYDYKDACSDIVRVMKHRYPTVRTPSGAYRQALVFDDFVVKFSKDDYRQEAILEEVKFISEMRADKKFARHFPETVVVQVAEAPVLIQQKVNMKHKGITWEMRSEVERLSDYLGISDMHEENYGWAGPADKLYPVFVDVDLRFNAQRPKKRRSWFV
jgi:hypothetical protein